MKSSLSFQMSLHFGSLYIGLFFIAELLILIYKLISEFQKLIMDFAFCDTNILLQYCHISGPTSWWNYSYWQHLLFARQSGNQVLQPTLQNGPSVYFAFHTKKGPSVLKSLWWPFQDILFMARQLGRADRFIGRFVNHVYPFHSWGTLFHDLAGKNGHIANRMNLNIKDVLFHFISDLRPADRGHHFSRVIRHSRDPLHSKRYNPDLIFN